MMMEIKDKIIKIVADCLETDMSSLDCNQDFFDMENFDSMRSVMILSQIEEAFDVMIPEDDIFDLISINAWVDEIVKLKQ